MKENEYEIDGVWYKIKPNEMEFIDEIAIQLTENTFGEDTFENYRGEGEIHFKKHAQDFYYERYDEVESLYINLIKNK
tara:strand:+ start:402 stop:635 length:234 start_codon:yes stop_codon:yes gene_type:complete